MYYRSSDRRRVVIPMHSNDLKRGTLLNAVVGVCARASIGASGTVATGCDCGDWGCYGTGGPDHVRRSGRAGPCLRALISLPLRR
ncbi:MAG: hypothetical protein HYV03_06035 [Deltaproteobacteria bacterium]|nr:hypothetical protein [Deltaproteobacteria bacterium]